MKLPHRRPKPLPPLVEHCPTCVERAELLRRGDLDCHIPEHADALRRYGQLLEEHHRNEGCAELVAALLADIHRCEVRAERAETERDRLVSLLRDDLGRRAA